MRESGHTVSLHPNMQFAQDMDCQDGATHSLIDGR